MQYSGPPLVSATEKQLEQMVKQHEQQIQHILRKGGFDHHKHKT